MVTLSGSLSGKARAFPIKLNFMRGPAWPVCKVPLGICYWRGTYLPTSHNGPLDSPPPMTTAAFKSSIYFCDGASLLNSNQARCKSVQIVHGFLSQPHAHAAHLLIAGCKGSRGIDGRLTVGCKVLQHSFVWSTLTDYCWAGISDSI